MSSHLARVFAICAWLLFSSSLWSQTPSKPDPLAGKKYIDGQLLVRFRPGTRPAVMQAAHNAVAANVLRSFRTVEGLQLVKLPPNAGIKQSLAAYRANPEVLYAEPDFVVHALQTPGDPLFPSMWSLSNTGQSGGTPGADIKAPQAWNITTGSSNVVVAILDTGVDYTHPDLAANIFTGPICPGGVVCHGINTIAITGTDPNDPMDDNGHGTHVAGTIGAIGNNSLGVTGINWNVTILPCKFLNSSGSGDTAAAIQCLDFIKSLKDTGINIVATNNSWGGGPFSQALQDAIDRQRQSGILFIAAAGNDFQNNDFVPTYPASFPLPNVIAVGASDRNDQRAFFSNTGNHSVHLLAPGQDILSTFLGGGYATESGTSMSTPHVTGVAALLAAQDPTRDWRTIKNLILAGGDLTPGASGTITGRRLDAFTAMTCTNSSVAKRLLPTTDLSSGSAGVAITVSALNINCGTPAGAVQVTVSPGGQTITLQDDGLAPDVAAGDGVYTGSFVPPGNGVFQLDFSTGDISTVQVLQNYQPAVAPFNYRTIAGTSLDLGDDDVAPIVSPFPIGFGNGSFTTMWASANGTISFSNAFSNYLHVFMPTSSPVFGGPPLVQASTLIAPFWGDLFPIKGTAQNVFWDVVGTAPNRELVVEWRDVRAFDCSQEPDTVKFQVVFFENSSDVLFNYADTIFGGNCADHDRGSAATIGLQVAPQLGTEWGTDGQEVNDGMALRWQIGNPPPDPGVPNVTSISPAIVDAYGPEFTITVNGSNFFPGSHVVLFGGFDRVTTFVSSTQLQALIPASDLDLFHVFTNTTFVGARNTGPSGTNFSPFSTPLTINNLPNPAITSVTPATGTANGFSFTLTVNGSNFSPSSVVNFNGQPVRTEGLSRSQLQATVDGSLVVGAGLASLTVTNPAPGGGTSAAFPYVVGAAPAAAPAAGSGSFLEQHDGSLPPLIPTVKQLPQRFLGWSFAQYAGANYLRRFTRPYGTVFTASAAEKTNATGASTSIGSAVAPALIDLNLRPATPAGFIPTGIAVGDFNRDGHMDWVVSNGGSNDLWVYQGNGDGTAQPPHIIPLKGQSPVQIIAADLRGIGILDLVLAEPDSISVGVLLGNGDGTFGTETIYFAPAPVLSIAVADFNRDGHLDVAAGLFGTNQTGGVSFFGGDGTGRLQAPIFTPLNTIFTNPVIAVGLAAGDLNHDGIPDLAVVDQDNVSEDGVYVFLGVGDGTFKREQNLGGLMNAAIGDLDGDGCADVVTLDIFGLAQVNLGNCDGTFRRLPGGFEFGEGESAIGMALVDLNGDGKLDLVTSGVDALDLGGAFGQESGALVSVLLGDGAGSFERAHVYRAQSGMLALGVADLNGDLHPDIIVPSQDTDSVSVLLNDGSGNLGGPQGQYIGWNNKGNPIVGGAGNVPVAAQLVDVNGDGKLDFVAIEDGQFGLLPFNVSVSLNDGTGHFLPDIKSPVMDGVFQFGTMAFGDFRKTGLPDMVVAPTEFSAAVPGHFFAVAPNLGAGQFGQPIITAIPTTPGTLATGDFNGDGNLDVLMAGPSATGIPPFQISVYLGNGDGTFRAGPTQGYVANSPPFVVLVGDFNGDGKLDILLRVDVGTPSTASVLEFLGNGDGSFAAGKAVITGATNGFGVIGNVLNVADINHDGRPDLIEKSFKVGFTFPVFNIYVAQPDGSFLLVNSYAPYSGGSLDTTGGALQFTESFVADFNGDGQVDIAALQADTGLPAAKYVQFLMGNGDGSFVPSFTKFPLGITPNAALPAMTGDIDGDGRADLVELDGVTSSFHVISSVAGTSLRLQFVTLPVIGPSGALRISLAVPAAADTPVQISSSDALITVPSTVTIPAGSLSQDFTIQIAPAFDPGNTFRITASVPGETAVALGSIALPGGPVGIFLATLNPPFAALLPGQSSSDLGLVVGSRDGYQTTASLHCDGLPAGATCQFGNTNLAVPAGGSNSTSLVISMSTRLPIGDYPFQVVGADNAISQGLPLTLHIGDFAASLVDSSGVALPNGFAPFQFNVSSINHFTGAVNFSCQGLPASATCSGTTAIATPIGTSPASMAVVTAGVPAGDYPFSIVGDTGFTNHSISAVLHVGDVGSASITPSAATLAIGQSATFALSVNSVNGFKGPIQLLCNPSVNGKPVSGVQCQFSPQTGSFDATGVLNSQLTISLIARPTNTVVRSSRSSLVSLLFFAVPIAILIGGGRKIKAHRALVCIGFLSLALVISCGGGGNSSGIHPPPGPNPTPTPATGPQTVKVDILVTAQSPQTLNRVITSVTLTAQ